MLLFIAGLLSLPAISQVFPTGFSRVQVASGISNPTVMAFAPDGRIFVAQQNGALRVIKNGALLATPFIQISVNSSGERGLIGIALDPNFATNQFVYLYYTLPDGSRNRISRFTGNGDVVVPGSEVVLLNLDPLSTATNHNGGAMHFKNGLLYVAVGENANGANAQNLDTYLGKILRINPDGSVPAGNPFTTGSEQRRRVWAYGLRNPYTFSIQPGTGRIFINDVGQNTWEEIDDATAGGLNFGWPTAEGTSTNPAFTNPIFSYPHGSGDGAGCAITGGVFFNPASSNYPAAYRGRYFFQDLCNRWINMLDLTTTPASRLPFATGLGGDALSIDVGNDGNLYYLERSTGALFKVIYTVNTTPAIVTQPSNQTVAAGQPATFSVTATGTAPLAYQWQKTNVSISGATGASYTIASAQPADAGAYRVIVSNASGSVTSTAATLTVTAFNNPPVAQIITPTAGTLYRGGDTINFSGNATDTEDGTLPASAFTWLVDFHHDTHRHDGPPVADGVKSGSFTIPTSGEVADNVWYRLILIVTDAGGLRDTIYRDILPQKSTITLATQPAGLQVTLDGQPVTTPLSDLSVEGIQRTIGVVSPQTLAGQTYAFDHWLHGGAATQTISTPVNDVTYTAVYRLSTLRTPENPANTVNGLNYAYYEGVFTALPNFSAITPVESGNVTNVDLGPRNREDDYAFQFTGYINVPTDGTYTFYTSSDDGSRLQIGTTTVVNNDGLHSTVEASGAIGLRSGKHAVTITFFEHLGGATLTASYAGPGIAKQLIPASAFYRAGTAPGIQTLEAENATLSGPVVSNIHAGYTGTGFADYVNATGDYVQWSASIAAAGSYTLTFRYALVSGARPLSVSVNGTVVNASLAFPPTGAWATWSTVTITTNLNAGTNTIRTTAIGSSGPNVDNLVIQSASAAMSALASAPVAETQGNDKLSLSTYPNPATRQLFVEVATGNTSEAKLSLMNPTGRVVKSQIFSGLQEGANTLTLDVDDMTSGLYWLRVERGTLSQSRSIVIVK
ncbi:Por secretion system C-terminal sorting domain-containing protein [Chryseolinea serpens]|uniref:Por secretion system C-terminal sorting domain-containing protein n=1 Tax=Chryseolinea serpens TaxID=947013 RepID=A0A1M5QUU2_9BACT|nr:PQQ-dependent sugar dehydrogenase [Chryseolinea serpens]SHH17885.1 Por secretion system C-terminal sorting domain-containing protein [Chryseolinea serpens]